MFKFDFDLEDKGEDEDENIEVVVVEEENVRSRVKNQRVECRTVDDVQVRSHEEKTTYALAKLYMQTDSTEEFVFIADKFGGDVGRFVAKRMQKEKESIETYLSAFEGLEGNVILAFARDIEGAFQDLSVSAEWIESMESALDLCPIMKILILSMAERCVEMVLFALNLLAVQEKCESEKEIISVSLYKWLGKLDRGREDFDDEYEFNSTQQSWGDVLSCVRKHGLMVSCVSLSHEDDTSEKRRKRPKPDPIDTLRDVMYAHNKVDMKLLRSALETCLLHKYSSHESVKDEDENVLCAFNRLIPHLGTSSEEELERFMSKYTSKLSLLKLRQYANSHLSPEGGDALLERRPYCQVCGRVVCVRLCTTCRVSSYCFERRECKSSDHNRHVRRCGTLLLSRAFEMLLNIKRFEDMLALSSRELSFRLDISNFASSSSLSKDLSWNCLFPLESCAIERVLATESLAFVLTVAYSMRISKISTCKNVCIHIIGAMRELRSNWNLLVELFPQVLRFRLIFVGPELNEDSLKSTCFSSRLDVSCFNDSYHECKHIRDDANICICMNAGIHHYDSWIPTLKCILERKSKTPLICTSWAPSEAIQTYARVRDVVMSGVKCDRKLSLQMNPFGSQLPIMTPDNHGECVYNSAYLMLCV